MDILTENYEDLANNIIIQAVKDYIRALRSKRDDRDDRIRELEKFFRSEWFRVLTKVDGEMLISRLKKEVLKNGKRKKITQPFRVTKVTG